MRRVRVSQGVRRLAGAGVRRPRRSARGGAVLRVRAARLRRGVVMHVVVVGAGIAGLSAAVHAAKLRPGARVSVLEASARTGGLIQTEHGPGGSLMEHGPDSLMIAKPAGARVVDELALQGELVRTGARGSFLLDERDRLIALPEGLISPSPSTAWALGRSPLLSVRGKLRFFLEPLVPRRRDGEEESVEAF